MVINNIYNFYRYVQPKISIPVAESEPEKNRLVEHQPKKNQSVGVCDKKIGAGVYKRAFKSFVKMFVMPGSIIWWAWLTHRNTSLPVCVILPDVVVPGQTVQA